MRTLTIVFVLSCMTLHSQELLIEDMQVHVPISVGASRIAGAFELEGGRVVVVGNLGRVGIVDLRTGSTTWEFIEGQSFLYGVSAQDSSIAVVGEGGLVALKNGSSVFRVLPKPDTATCRSVCFRGSNLVVTTMTGDVWEYSSIEGWRNEYSGDAPLYAVSYSNGRCVAVGGLGRVVVWTEATGMWTEVAGIPSSRSHGGVLVTSTFSIIGSDSGFAYRLDHESGLVQTLRVMAPISFNREDNIFGRFDKTIAIRITSEGYIQTAGNYFPSRAGVYESRDSGRSFQRLSFEQLNTTRTDFGISLCPLIAHVDAKLRAVVWANDNIPAVLTHDPSEQRWLTNPIRGLYQFRANSSGTIEPYTETVDGIARGEAEGEVITVLTQYFYPQGDELPKEGQTIICRTITNSNSTTIDTLVTWEGRFILSYASDGVFVCNGDSNRIVVSTDFGSTWRAGNGIIESNFLYRYDRTIVFDDIVVCNRQGKIFTAPLATLNFSKQEIPKGISDDPICRAITATSASSFSAHTIEWKDDSIKAAYLDDWVIDADTLRHTNRTPIDHAFTENAALFSSGDTALLAVKVIDTLSGYRPYHLRCRILKGILTCDTMLIDVLDGPDSTLTILNQLNIVEDGGTLFATAYYSYRFVSINNGRTWQLITIPQSFGFVGPTLTFAKIGDRLHLGGLKSAHLSCKMRTLPTHVDEPRANSEREPNYIYDFLVSPGTYEIFNTTGNSIRLGRAKDEQHISLLCENLVDGVYFLVTSRSNTHGARIFVIRNGSIAAIRETDK